KNKKVRSAIKVFLSDLKFPKEMMYNVADSIAFHERRVRELSPEELALIFNELYEKVIVSGKVKKAP
ncbi:MAG: hypothetical protein QXT84_06620, partial [Candidatus Bathyarchaeia archaeon]